MRFAARISLCILIFTTAACSHVVPLGEGDQVWVAHQYAVGGVVMFCKVLKSEDGKKINPVCYEAGDLSRKENLKVDQK